MSDYSMSDYSVSDYSMSYDQYGATIDPTSAQSLQFTQASVTYLAFTEPAPLASFTETYSSTARLTTPTTSASWTTLRSSTSIPSSASTAFPAITDPEGSSHLNIGRVLIAIIVIAVILAAVFVLILECFRRRRKNRKARARAEMEAALNQETGPTEDTSMFKTAHMDDVHELPGDGVPTLVELPADKQMRVELATVEPERQETPRPVEMSSVRL